MEIGDIDGKFAVYDENGNLILMDKEKILFKAKVEVNVMKKERVGYKPLLDIVGFKYGENATLYRTTHRLVCIRKPSVWEAKSDITPFGMPSAVSKMAKARRLDNAKAYQYCNILLNDISECKKSKWNTASLKVSFSDTWCSVSFVPDRPRSISICGLFGDLIGEAKSAKIVWTNNVDQSTRRKILTFEKNADNWEKILSWMTKLIGVAGLIGIPTIIFVLFVGAIPSAIFFFLLLLALLGWWKYVSYKSAKLNKKSTDILKNQTKTG